MGLFEEYMELKMMTTMSRRARSLSRFRGTTPGREATPSIYEYGSAADGTGGSGYSTRLNVYTPDVYGALSRVSRATSVARFKDVDNELLGSDYNRWNRSRSVGRYDYLRAKRPYSAYGTHDFDYFDRYTERIRDKTPIALDSHYTHYRPYYWYHTAPRTFYYNFPYDDWRYRPFYTYRSPALYSAASNDSSYNNRFNDSIDRVSSLKRAMRDIDYTRELRQLRFPTPSTFSAISHDGQYLDRAREDVRRTIDSRVGGRDISRLNNPRDYFGQTFVRFEKDGVNNVGVQYNGLTKTVEHKPSYWKAEDNLETGYELQAQNDDTLNKLYDNQDRIDASREWLLQDRAGIAPRMFRFDMDSRRARRDVDNTLRLVRNLKQYKHETFNRLSQPWSFGRYLY
ncbi:unnamed protein product [Rotaria magnacalcarata]|nr:unnamed protein product [Rotaria magnacalcarata]CAF1660945.1 unnamed protein product [Rotaria magnacalcarata]CAF1905823.1 unnamed protein product [Rotaria magnacalcarata]CAF3812061.1 unnamed protein product [Rotaria magnacalcarata]CAF3870843.1 unnamed protein product [Rotaria magnacalcarata]